jgi:hypothetical protein
MNPDWYWYLSEGRAILGVWGDRGGLGQIDLPEVARARRLHQAWLELDLRHRCAIEARYRSLRRKGNMTEKPISYVPTSYYAVLALRRVNGQLQEAHRDYLGAVKGKTFKSVDTATAAAAMCSAANRDSDIVFAVVYYPDGRELSSGNLR